MMPGIGRIVHYRLAEGDVAAIEKRVTELLTTGQRAAEGSSGAATPGQVCAALIVSVRDYQATGRVNLTVFLDGGDTFGAPARAFGEGPGSWSWPKSISAQPVGVAYGDRI